MKNESKLNQNKKAILVVSFGTSFDDTREKTIGAIEKEVKAEFPNYDVRRAFTSQMIIDKLKNNGVEIDNVNQAMQRLIDDGYVNVTVQPTHIMNGYEYDKMVRIVKPFEDRISVSYGNPMLSSNSDYEKVVYEIAKEIHEINNTDTAIILVGHGSEHFANSAYAALAYRFNSMGYNNCFVGTVEGFPDMEDIKARVRETGVSKVVLLPFMIVAGDHASNDICGKEDGSWYTEFKNEGYDVTVYKKGLGEYAGLRRLFVEHIRNI